MLRHTSKNSPSFELSKSKKPQSGKHERKQPFGNGQNSQRRSPVQPPRGGNPRGHVRMPGTGHRGG